MRGYKILDRDFRCRGLSYRVGETAVHPGAIQPCVSGLHFCPRALDCIRYYPLKDTRYAEVHAETAIQEGDKCVTGRLTIVREIPRDEFLTLCTGELESHLWSITREIHTYVAGVLHGPFTRWYASGQRMETGEYVAGALHGQFTRWWPDGQLQEESELAKGKLHGMMTRWSNGQRAWQASWVEGRQHGPEIEWINGQKSSEVEYVAGLQHGKAAHWSNGQLTWECTYVRGKLHGLMTRWHNGQRTFECPYVDGKKHGEMRTWDEQGVLSEERTYTHGTFPGETVSVTGF